MKPQARTSPVVVHGDRVSVRHLDVDVARAEAHHRAGGVDPLAAVTGALAGVGTLLVLGTLLSSVLAVGYQQGLSDRDALSWGGYLGGLVLLAVAGLAAGWVAGRSGRYDGGRNGLLAGVLLVVVTAVVALAASAQAKGVRTSALPSWVTDGAGGGRAALTALVAAVLCVLAALLGGRLGSGWHRKADDALLRTRVGGVTPYPSGDPSGDVP